MAWPRIDGSYEEVRSCKVCGSGFTRQPKRSNAVWSRQKTCSPGCGSEVRRKPEKSAIQEFMARAMPEPNTGCWIWTGYIGGHGYGWLTVNRKRIQAHRFSLEHFKGESLSGLFACHTCDNTWCVNPDHLYAGTAADNARDCSERGRHSRQQPNGGTASERALFERRFRDRGLDFSLDKDAWGRDKYRHSYIGALFDGWRVGFADSAESATNTEGL